MSSLLPLVCVLRTVAETLGSLKAEGELLALLEQPGDLDACSMTHTKGTRLQVKGGKEPPRPVPPRKQSTPQRRPTHDPGLSIKHPHGGNSYKRRSQRRPIHDPGLSIKRPHGGASCKRGHRDFANIRDSAEPRGQARRAKA